jgi:hypothetical protein
MGTGANVQVRLIGLHHLDAPWRPADVEQREGRVLRQGNLNREVQVFRYVTEESFDACMWQTLETKARFIAQVLGSGVNFPIPLRKRPKMRASAKIFCSSRSLSHHALQSSSGFNLWTRCRI